MALHIAGGVAGLLICVLAASIASRLVRRGLEGRGANPDTLLLIPRLLFFALLGLGLTILVSGVFREPSFAFNSVLIASLIAGLGLQDLVKNYVSGFYLLFEGNLKVGDHVKTDAFTGEVTDIRLRVTYLKGEDGAIIIAPNSELFNKTVQINQPAPRPAGRGIGRRRPRFGGQLDEPPETGAPASGATKPARRG